MGARVAVEPAAGARFGRRRGSSRCRSSVPGDFSSAAPLIVAATLLAGSELRIHGVNLNPTRTGLLDVLERMGARIAVFNRRMLAGEPAGDLEVRSAELTATGIERRRRCRASIDELPLFALAAGMARGESVVEGAQELRAKEIESHRDGDDLAQGARHPDQRARRRLRGEGRADPPEGWGDASSTAITASRCSARSPGSSPAKESRSGTPRRSL